MYTKITTVLLTAAVLLAFLSPSGDAQVTKPRPAAPKPSTTAPALVAVTVSTDKYDYKAGEPMQITVTLRNPSSSPVRLPFSSGQRYELELRRGDDGKGERVWQWSKGMMFPMAMSNITLGAGKTQTWKETLDPAKASVTLDPGIYTLTAAVATSGRMPLPTSETLISVESPSEQALAQVPRLTTEFRDLEVTFERAVDALSKEPTDPARRSAYVSAAYAYGKAVMDRRDVLPPRVMYPAAVALFRRALAVAPDHKASRTSIKTIADVYRGMGRNVPQ